MLNGLRALDIGDHRTEYHDVGAGPAVMLIHGGQCSADDWAGVAESLSKHHRLILPDGLVHPLDPWRLWLLLDHLGIDSVVLAGHSAGGTTVREMYRLQPGRVRGVLMIDASGLGPLTLARKLPNDLFSPQAAALYERNRAGMEQLRRHHRGDYPSDVTIDRRLKAYRTEQMSPQQRAATRPPPDPVERIDEVRPAPIPIDATGRFVTCPVMVIQTGRGKMAPEDVPRETIERDIQAADVEYIMIKEAGHWPWLEQPAAFLSLIEPFLARARRLGSV